MNTKKSYIKLRLFYTFIFFLFTSSTALAYAFLDVQTNYKYNEAISYLKSHNIIQGYSDGTFKPDKPINRAEFLKIALEATGVRLDSNTQMNFTDTDNSAWYAKYVSKAQEEGWIQGYSDGTFKPDQPVNKVEALKILGEIQSWNRLTTAEVPESSFKDTYRFSWYSPYLYFAKENDLLFEETDYFHPNAEVKRGYMAELVYRTITKGVINYEPSKTIEEQIIEEPIVATPSTFKMIDTNYFDNLTLSEKLPNIMYKNEVYILKGTFDPKIEVNDVFAFLSEDTGETKTYTHFLGTVQNNTFTIPIIFKQSGTFHLGIVPGLSGNSKIADITVLDGIPKSGNESNLDVPNSVNISFANDKTTVSWTSSKNNIFRIYFMQDNNLQSYIVRGKKSLDVIFNDFKFFNEGDVNLRIYGAQSQTLFPAKLKSKWAKSKDITFKATKHQFKLSNSDSITYSTLPEILPSIQKIYVSGTTYEPIYSHGAVITPSGDIDTFDIETDSDFIDYYGNSAIQTGSNFSFVYSPSETGTYIIEINNLGGSALVNVPIYIGDAIPLIPDFFDLQDPFETTENLNLQDARLELLNYINIERQKHGLNSVRMLDKLNTLAQNHTNDMAKNDYFAHVNLQGETPDDRRIKLSIYTDVGENLAIAPTVYFGHKALMRSAIHRKNILTPYWDTVGIGITKDSNNHLIIAEEFSHDPWTQQDMQEFEYYLLDNINEERTSPLQADINMQEIARNWSRDMITRNYFSFISPSGENLIDVVQDKGFTNEGRAYILKEGSIESLLKKLLEESDITQDQWNKVGFGLEQDLWSTLYLTVVFTQ